MSEPVPESWKKKVRDILQTGDGRRILIRQRARRDWQMLFPDYNDNLPEVLADVMGDEKLHGRRVHDMNEPGETYEFIFEYKKQRIYSKINLTPGGEAIIVYSAHRPLKGDTL